jgi:hypothetical protein
LEKFRHGVDFGMARSTNERKLGRGEGRLSPERQSFKETRMKYVCLGFFDETKFAEIPQADAQRMIEDCFAYDDELRRSGHFLGGEALDSARNAVTLRMKAGEAEVTDGPFVETKETLGGIMLLEARDLNHAISLISKHPGLKIGPFEIRPANEAVNQRIAERTAAFVNKA